MKQVDKPIRMCIMCKQRDVQSNLIRLQCIDKKLINHSGVGRSFYICKSCIDNKKLFKMLSHKCKIEVEELRKNLKEILFNA